MQPAIHFSSILPSLTPERLVEVGSALGISLPSNAREERQVEAFLEAAPSQLSAVVGLLQRDELKVVCGQHSLPDGGRAHFELAKRLLDGAGIEGAGPAPTSATEDEYRDLPRPGDVVRVRHRQYLVETVNPPTESRRPGGPMVAHRVRLVGLEDDSQGRPLEVLWEAELGAQIRQGQSQILAEPAKPDAPRAFGAYLATLRWHGVTATDARLFQAPFCAAGSKPPPQKVRPRATSSSSPTSSSNLLNSSFSLCKWGS